MAGFNVITEALKSLALDARAITSVAAILQTLRSIALTQS
jgi:hypothetical protein